MSWPLWVQFQLRSFFFHSRTRETRLFPQKTGQRLTYPDLFPVVTFVNRLITANVNTVCNYSRCSVCYKGFPVFTVVWLPDEFHSSRIQRRFHVERERKKTQGDAREENATTSGQFVARDASITLLCVRAK